MPRETRSSRARGQPRPQRRSIGPRDVSLPLALTMFLGRDADVHVLRAWLADPTARLITLTGPGGAGKTRLALEVARTKVSAGGRVLFVGLAAVRHAALVAPAIAEALGVRDPCPFPHTRNIRRRPEIRQSAIG